MAFPIMACSTASVGMAAYYNIAGDEIGTSIVFIVLYRFHLIFQKVSVQVQGNIVYYYINVKMALR